METLFNLLRIRHNPQPETAFIPAQSLVPTNTCKKSLIACLLLIQLYTVCSFIIWKWWDFLRNHLFLFGFAISFTYAVEIRILFSKHVTPDILARLLVTGYLSTYVALVIMKSEKEYPTMGQSGIFLICIFRPYITSKKPLWFERIFYFAFDLILLFVIIWAIDRQGGRVDMMAYNKKIIRETVQALSHELRTPIHGILASAEFLESSTLSDFQRTLIDTVQSSGCNWIQIIDRVLASLDMESQGVSRALSFNLYRAMDEICAGMAVLFEKKNIDIFLHYKVPWSSSVLEGDVGIIKQIILSLFGFMDSATSHETIVFIVDSKESEKGHLNVLFDIQAYGEVAEVNLNDDTATSLSSAQDRKNIDFTRGLIEMIGGKLCIEQKQRTEGGQQIVPVLRFKVSIKLPISEDEVEMTNQDRLMPSKYLTKKLPEDIDLCSILRIGVLIDSLFPEALNIQKILQQDFSLSSIIISSLEEIKIDENKKDSINTIIIDTSLFSREQLMILADSFSKKKQIVSVLFVRLLQQEKIYIIFENAGFEKRRFHSIIKHKLLVIWN
ncbi:8299_t:CDS:10 [Ambispora leptoticha]|uniref:8299_t:CDS:1 n=1 Tax=Ambispora leptoticha TaxID=144679 RepID=A0A9N9CVD8_9GLOM|nr:8299_t:CDS:10 [Ambispora leptoticha]